ncbi:MAG: antirestriction protein ArdA [Rhodobacter sp.]|nr:antirestriction protein ArdA [Rhodobacter sp.]
MTITLFAQPYDICATGFFFISAEEYDEKAKTLTNAHGDPVEEFEIQFIDGAQIDCEMAKAVGINQANFRRLLQMFEEWDDHEKIKLAIAVGECGYAFDLDGDDIDLLDVDIYEEESLRVLAIRFVEDGLFDDIPEHLQSYIDHDAIARDLGVDYTETVIAGARLVYRCG